MPPFQLSRDGKRQGSGIEIGTRIWNSPVSGTAVRNREMFAEPYRIVVGRNDYRLNLTFGYHHVGRETRLCETGGSFGLHLLCELLYRQPFGYVGQSLEVVIIGSDAFALFSGLQAVVLLRLRFLCRSRQDRRCRNDDASVYFIQSSFHAV